MAQKIDYDIESAFKAGLTESDISSYLKSKGHTDADISSLFKADFSDVKSGSSTYEKPKKPKLFSEENFAKFRESSSRPYPGDKISDLLAAARDETRFGAVLSGSLAVGLGTKSPLAGNVSYSALDEGLRYLQGVPSGGGAISGTKNPVLSGLENAAVGEITGIISSKTAALIKEAIKPGSVVGNLAAKLKPTFSGYFEKAPISKKLEETARPALNAARKAEINETAKAEVDRFIRQETGVKPVDVTKPVFIPGAKQIIVDPSNLGNPTSHTANPLFKEMNQLLDSPVDLQTALSQGSYTLPSGATIKSSNMRQGLAAYDMRRMMNDSVDPATGNIDGKTLWQAFKNPGNKDKFHILYGAGNRDRYAEFFKSMANATSPEGVYSSSFIERSFQYGTIGLTGGLLPYILSGSTSKAVAGGGIVAIYALNKGSKAGLSTLLNNPESARLLAAAAKGGALGMSHEAASRAIGRVIIGYKAKAKNADGSFSDGVINDKGQFEPTPAGN